MANVKITDLSAIADPASTDVLPVVDVTADTTNKISIAEILKTAPDGTAAAPAIAFEGDSNTGIYHPGSEQIGFATSGIGRVFIASDGSVGIGTSSPAYRLTVAESDSTSVSVKSTGDNTTTRSARYIWSFDDGDGAAINGTRTTGTSASDVYLTFRTGGITNSEERLRIDSDGNVGIGTSIPNAKLNVKDISTFTLNTNTIDYTAFLEGGDTAGNGNYGASIGFSRINGGTRTGAVIATKQTSNDADQQGIAFLTHQSASTNSNLVEQLLVTHDGNVGIGTSSPGQKLSIFGPETSTTDYGQDLLVTNEGTLSNNGHALNEGPDITFGLRRSSDGALAGSAYIKAVAEGDLFSSWPTSLVFALQRFGVAPAEAMRIVSNGNVGIGTSNPQSELVIRGSTPQFSLEPTADTQNCRIQFATTNGTIQSSIFGGGSDGSAIRFFNNVTSSESLRIDSSGRLLVGTSSSRANFNNVSNSTKVQIEGTGFRDSSFSIVRNVNSTAAGGIIIAKTRSENVGGNGQVSINDLLGSILFQGQETASANNNFVQAAKIAAFVDGTPGANAMPGRLVFSTTADGASSPTERMRIDSSGNVGIGTTAPNDLVHLSSADSTLRIDTKRNGTTYGNSAILFGSPRSSSADNTTVNGRGLLVCLGNSTSNSSTVWLQAQSASLDPTDTDADLKTNQCGIRLSSDGSFQHWAGGSQRFNIDTSGRLLVGTSSDITGNTATSIQAVQINGPATSALGRGGTSIGNNQELGRIYFYSTGGNGTTWELGASIAGVADGTHATGDKPTRLVFSTTADGASSPTERMRINSDGAVIAYSKLGIGAAPEDTSIGSVATLSFVGATNPRIYAAASSGTAHIFACLEVSGTICTFRSQTTSVGSISVTTTATAYNTSSDYRLKENVVPLANAADRLNQLQVHRFNFIADPDNTVDGFLAHEAQAVVPECVTGTKDEVDDEGNPVYQGIDQSKLVPLLTGALQEALAKIEALEQRLADAGL